MLSLDCEGCEFEISNDFFDCHKEGNGSNENQSSNCASESFMQIIIQVHGAPTVVANNFFSRFQEEQYVIFSKDTIRHRWK